MVREGYKQTEVRMIPKNWNYDSLQDKVTLISGRHILSANYNNEGIGKPYLTGPADFEQGKSEVSKWTTENGVEADSGDILITVKGSGAGSSFRLDLERAVISRQLMALRGKDDLCQDYLFYVFTQQERDLASKAIGNLIPGLGRKDILELTILLPPLPEQRSIAQALSDVDALIASLDKAIAKKRAIKTATMQQLLTGKKRLPGFGEGKGYKESAIGLIPEDWKVVTYGEHFNIISGLGFKKSEYTDYGVSLLRIDNVSYGRIAWDSIAFLPQEYIEKYKELVINQDDILLALNRPITNGKLKIAVAKESDVPAILYQRVGKIIFTSQEYDKHYAFYLLSKFIKQFVEESSVGSDQPFISTSSLKKYKILLPLEKEEQRAIATVLSDMDTEIAALESRLAKTRSIKQGMMQELLTGRTRLV